jgi:hypothetical protein
MKPGYVLISGHGRSGTNWLLSVLDKSPYTHCRNEPSHLRGSALAALGKGSVVHEEMPNLEAGWDDAVDRASRSFGMRDHPFPVRKQHFRGTAQALGMVRAARAKRLHAWLGRLSPSLGKEEWPIPSWLFSRGGAETLMPVLKLNLVPGWVVWALQNRPQARVLHIVRHPGGFLNSWRNRWLSRADPDQVMRDNHRLLKTVAKAAPEWAIRFGDIESLSVVESELWYWKYANETTYALGSCSPNYKLIIYGDMVADPVGVAREVYGHCGLPWDADIESSVRSDSRDSSRIAAAWRSSLTSEDVACVERALEGSPFRGWWDAVVA